MRLHIVLTSQKRVVLPWDYLNMLRGFLYSAIRRSKPELGEFLHEQGFVAEGHRYKLLNFSLLFPKSAKAIKTAIEMIPPIHWWVSSPFVSTLEALVLTLLSEGKVRLGKIDLEVEKVEVERSPELGNQGIFKTLSPIVVSSGIYKNGKLEHLFLSPEDEKFWKVLEQNLRRKAKVLGINAPAEPLKFEKIGKWRSKLFEIETTKVKGWEGSFFVQGPSELIKIGYEAGFGERNTQGFGMVRLKAHLP